MKLSAGEKKRRQIFDAVFAVIAADGVDAVTHRSVGKQAGVSHGVVSYHFSTRDSLIFKFFEYYFGSVEDYQNNFGWKPGEKMSKHQLVDFLCAIVAEEMANPANTLVEQELILIAARKPELAALYRDWEARGVDLLVSGLKRSGYMRPKRSAHILYNLVRGFLLESLTDSSLNAKHFKSRVKVLFAGLPTNSSAD